MSRSVVGGSSSYRVVPPQSELFLEGDQSGPLLLEGVNDALLLEGV
jgi:hypothetical protein